MTFFRSVKRLWLGFISLLIGMKVTLKNCFLPAVTLNYPLTKQPMTANFRGMVDLIPEACVICYQCIKICPTAALYLSHKQVMEGEKKKNEITKFTFNAELCCYCGLCDEICPTDAIFMNKQYEISALSHDQIVNIDLMTPNKYTHLNPTYDFGWEVKRNADNTVGKANKPPAAAPAATPAPAGKTTAAPTVAPTVAAQQTTAPAAQPATTAQPTAATPQPKTIETTPGSTPSASCEPTPTKPPTP